MVAAEERVGNVLNATYKLVRLIGQGGMGSVYQASHLRLPRSFAIKLLHQGSGHHPQAVERFRREAEIASSLGEEHIAEVVDFNHAEDGAPYLVMEMLEGEDLSARIRRRRRLTLKETARMVDHVAVALTAAHARGIVHRDLKPENIFMCTRDGRDDFVKVLDFGISKIRGSASTATQTGAMLGTPNFMAPEQALGQANVDHRADIFALGAIVYECLTGKMAFDGTALATVIDQICFREPTPIRSLNPEVPENVEPVLLRALAKDPAARYPTVVQFRNEFLRVAGYRTVHDPLVTVGIMAPSPAAIAAAAPVPAVPAQPPTDAAAVATLVMGAPPIHDGPRTLDLTTGALGRAVRPRGRVAAVVALAGLSGAAGLAWFLARGPAPLPLHAAVVPAQLPAAAMAPNPTVRPPPAAAPAPAPTVAPPAPAAPPPPPAVAPVPVPMVRIRFTSRPKGAQVLRLADKSVIGKTPLNLPVAKGKGRVGFLLRKTGYRDRIRWVTPAWNKVVKTSLLRAKRPARGRASPQKTPATE